MVRLVANANSDVEIRIFRTYFEPSKAGEYTRRNLDINKDIAVDAIRGLFEHTVRIESGYLGLGDQGLTLETPNLTQILIRARLKKAAELQSEAKKNGLTGLGYITWEHLLAGSGLVGQDRDFLEGKGEVKFIPYNDDEILAAFEILREFRAIRYLSNLMATVQERLYNQERAGDIIADVWSDTGAHMTALRSDDGVRRSFTIDPDQPEETKASLDYIREVISRPEGENQILTGIKAFDEANGGFPRTGVAIIAANSGGGKSLVSQHLAKTMAMNGLAVSFGTLENSLEQNARRLTSSVSQLPLTRLTKGGLGDSEQKICDDALAIAEKEVANKGGSFFMFQPLSARVENLLEDARTTKTGRATNVIFVDYVGLLDVDHENQAVALSNAVRYGKIFAQRHDCLVVYLAQFDAEKGQIRYSRAMQEHADVMWSWVKDPDVPVVNVSVDKGRECPRIPFQMFIQTDIMSVRDLTPAEQAFFRGWRPGCVYSESGWVEPTSPEGRAVLKAARLEELKKNADEKKAASSKKSPFKPGEKSGKSGKSGPNSGAGAGVQKRVRSEEQSDRNETARLAAQAKAARDEAARNTNLAPGSESGISCRPISRLGDEHDNADVLENDALRMQNRAAVAEHPYHMSDYDTLQQRELDQQIHQAMMGDPEPESESQEPQQEEEQQEDQLSDPRYDYPDNAEDPNHGANTLEYDWRYDPAYNLDYDPQQDPLYDQRPPRPTDTQNSKPHDEPHNGDNSSRGEEVYRNPKRAAAPATHPAYYEQRPTAPTAEVFTWIGDAEGGDEVEDDVFGDIYPPRQTHNYNQNSQNNHSSRNTDVFSGNDQYADPFGELTPDHLPEEERRIYRQPPPASSAPQYRNGGSNPHYIDTPAQCQLRHPLHTPTVVPTGYSGYQNSLGDIVAGKGMPDWQTIPVAGWDFDEDCDYEPIDEYALIRCSDGAIWDIETCSGRPTTYHGNPTVKTQAPKVQQTPKVQQESAKVLADQILALYANTKALAGQKRPKAKPRAMACTESFLTTKAVFAPIYEPALPIEPAIEQVVEIAPEISSAPVSVPTPLPAPELARTPRPKKDLRAAARKPVSPSSRMKMREPEPFPDFESITPITIVVPSAPVAAKKTGKPETLKEQFDRKMKAVQERAFARAQELQALGIRKVKVSRRTDKSVSP